MGRTMKKIVSFLAVSAVLIFVSNASAQIFVANLAPGNERPTPFPDSTMGGLAVASVTVNDDGTSDALIVMSAFGNETTITMAHVHIGDADTAGPVICPLFTGAFPGNPVIATCNFNAERTT